MKQQFSDRDSYKKGNMGDLRQPWISAWRQFLNHGTGRGNQVEHSGLPGYNYKDQSLEAGVTGISAAERKDLHRKNPQNLCRGLLVSLAACG